MVQAYGSLTSSRNQDPESCPKIPLQEEEGRETVANSYGLKIWTEEVSDDGSTASQDESFPFPQVLKHKRTSTSHRYPKIEIQILHLTIQRPP
jgi:hypothetical protein